MGPAFSIFARAFRIEAPFLNEWLEHHFGLGFSKVYLCVAGRGEKTAEEREFLLQHIAPEFLSRIQWLESPRHAGVAAIYEQLNLGALWGEDERVLIIDIDEFLILQRHATISEFCEEVGGQDDGLFFEWVNYASDEWGYAGLASQMRDEPPWAGVNGKTMVRSGAVKKLKVHRHLYVRGASRRDVDISDAFLAHLCSRGYADILCRILYNSVKTDGQDIALMREMLLGPNLPQNLPRRLILLYAQMLMARLDDHPAPTAKALPPLRYGCDQETLDGLVGSALGEGGAGRGERTLNAMKLAKRFDVEFVNSREEIRDLGGFVAMCKRLRVARREVIRDGVEERVRYTVAAVPRDHSDYPEPGGSRWFRWLTRRG